MAAALSDSVEKLMCSAWSRVNSNILVESDGAALKSTHMAALVQSCDTDRA